MRPTTIIGAFSLFVLVAVVPAGAGDVIEGVLTAVSESSLTIDGHRYVVTNRTQCQDKAGRRVDPAELQAGAPVEAEIEEGDELGVVTVDLLR